MKNLWTSLKNSIGTSLIYSSIGSLSFSIIDFIQRIIAYGIFDIQRELFIFITFFFYSFILILFPTIIGGIIISHFARKDLLNNREFSEKRSIKRGAILALFAALIVSILFVPFFVTMEPYQQKHLVDFGIYINPYIRAIEAMLIAVVMGAFAGKRIHAKVQHVDQSQNQE